uniref:Uncharacterized protein n=1 Tax=Megaselia scalaris TaxID=36166 RepID=T1H0Y3_MEGSC
MTLHPLPPLRTSPPEIPINPILHPRCIKSDFRICSDHLNDYIPNPMNHTITSELYTGGFDQNNYVGEQK